MKRVIVLGASGSIGTQSIDVIKDHDDELELVGISVYNQKDYALKLLKEFKLSFVALKEKDEELEKQYPDTTFFYGENGLEEIVKVKNYDLLINALVGFNGFIPTLRAIENNKDVALANKETLVSGGDIIYDALKASKSHLYPIDSEHSAIDQCLSDNKAVKSLIITASGGAFRDLSREELKNVTKEKALNHPVWAMGAKITIDSATMMNKGFEVIEAHHLFNVAYKDIKVLIHPESIIHSMVEYTDGSIIAQLSCPDMRLPIQYAILRRHDIRHDYKPLDLAKVMTLNFKEIDLKRFPLLKLAFEAGEKGGNLPCVLNGANDEAVRLFLEDKITFLKIEEVIFEAIKKAEYIPKPGVQDLIKTHNWAKEFVDTYFKVRT